VEDRKDLRLVDYGLPAETFNKIARANPWGRPFLLALGGDDR